MLLLFVIIIIIFYFFLIKLYKLALGIEILVSQMLFTFQVVIVLVHLTSYLTTKVKHSIESHARPCTTSCNINLDFI